MAARLQYRVLAALLPSLLTACPVAIPATGQIAHACEQSADCPSGQTCLGQVCAAVFQDAGVGGDATLGDASTVDVAGPDQAQTDANLADTSVPDRHVSDTNLLDTNGPDANLSDTNFSDANLSDTNVSDVNLSDTHVSDTNLSDANLSDTNLPDTNVSDTNLSDSSVSDTAQTDTAKPSCVAQFGTAGSFSLCQELSDRCTFYAVINTSCDLECQRFGSTCVSAGYDSSNGCQVSGEATCGEYHGDAVCGCAR